MHNSRWIKVVFGWAGIGLTACGWIKPSAIDVHDPGKGGAETTFSGAAPRFAGWGGHEQDEVRLRAAVEDTLNVIKSERFQRRVAAAGGLFDAKEGSAVPPMKLLNKYLHERVPVIYSPASGQYDAGTDPPKSETTTNIGLGHVARWIEGTNDEAVLRRACIINTLAHELTHAIKAEQGGCEYTDDGHARSKHPLVSYAIGSIAHCTYLEENKLIEEKNFWACVETVGTNVYWGNLVCEVDPKGTPKHGLNDVLIRRFK